MATPSDAVQPCWWTTLRSKMSLIHNRIQGWHFVDLVVSLAAASVMFGGIFVLHKEIRGDVAGEGAYVALWAVMILSLGAHSVITNRFRRSALGLAMGETMVVGAGQTATVAFAMFAFMVAFKERAVSRVFLIALVPALHLALIISRQAAQKWLAPLIFDRTHECTALLVGLPSKAGNLVSWLRSKGRYGLRIAGWVTDECVAVPADALVLGRVADLESVIAKVRPGVVFTTELNAADRDLHSLRELCDRYGARLAFSLGLPEDIPCGITCYQEEGVNLIALRNEPLESPLNRLVKRSLDVAISLPVVALVLPPIAIVVWLLQRMQSPGPLLFRQTRVGLRNAPFVMLKFRTMHPDNPDESRQVREGDERVYPVGRILRKLSLDEFPQFVNVLLGHMSIVGPRPHFGIHDEEFAKISGDYRIRSLIKPGITGLAQVKGLRGVTDTHEDVRLRTRADLFYLEHWSVWLDLVIIVRTAMQLLLGAKKAV